MLLIHVYTVCTYFPLHTVILWWFQERNIQRTGDVEDVEEKK